MRANQRLSIKHTIVKLRLLNNLNYLLTYYMTVGELLYGPTPMST